MDEKESAKAARIVEEASRIIEWYGQNLFPDQMMSGEMFFISHNSKQSGGFNRHITVELERFYSPDKVWGRFLLAHEIAHSWSISEPPATWNEQMFAEGGADWSFLLISLSEGRLQFIKNYFYLTFFRCYLSKINSMLYRDKTYSPHLHGFLFYKGVYKKYGADAVKSCIRHFAGAKLKTGDGFLSVVKENETEEFYDYIEKLINKHLK